MRTAKKERRERMPDGAFAAEQQRLCFFSATPSETIRRLTKGSESDRQYGRDLIWAIEHFEIAKGVARAERIRNVDSEEGRRLFRFFLRIVGLMERGEGSRKGELRVDGAAGWWGRAEAPGARPQRARLRPTRMRVREDDEADRPLSFDRTSKTFRLNPSVRPYKSRKKLVRRYCPKGQTGGLAARHEVTVRTIGNWARFLREAGFVGCKQPPRNAADAYRSRRQGDYPYGIWRILRKLPSRMMQRLQLVWGELERAVGDLAAKREEQQARVELSKLQAEYGHERAPPRKRRSELDRELDRGERAARELFLRPLP